MKGELRIRTMSMPSERRSYWGVNLASVSRRRVRPRRGFTLFELVVALSIVVILATLGMIGYQSATPPGAVSAARNELHGLLRFSRQQAILRGSNAMLIINYNESDPEKFLRYAGVIVEDGYNSANWQAAHSGVYLPEGVYFVPQIVDGATDGFAFEATWPADDELKSQYDCTNGASSLAIGGVEYPVRQDVSLDAALGNEQDWIGFQFGPDGRVDKVDFSACSGATGNQDKRLVLGLAGYEGGTRLTFVDSDKAMGVVVRVNGVSYAVDDLSSL